MYADNCDSNILKNDNDVTIRPLSKIVAPSIKYTELRNGELQSYDEILLDSRLVEGDSSNYLFIQTTTESFIVDVSVKQISNGSWLVDIDGVKSIVKVARIPGNKLVVHQEETTFECAVDDVAVVGRVVKVIKSI
ncbi:TPA: phage repressor protein, partial [Escherichia coli]